MCAARAVGVVLQGGLYSCTKLDNGRKSVRVKITFKF